MCDGCKRILSPFTGCKKRTAWSKTREKYMPVKRRQNLAEIDRGSYYKWLEKFLDSYFASEFCNSNDSDNDDESYNESNEQQQLSNGFCQYLLQNSFTGHGLDINTTLTQ